MGFGFGCGTIVGKVFIGRNNGIIVFGNVTQISPSSEETVSEGAGAGVVTETVAEAARNAVGSFDFGDVPGWRPFGASRSAKAARKPGTGRPKNGKPGTGRPKNGKAGADRRSAKAKFGKPSIWKPGVWKAGGWKAVAGKTRSKK